MYTQVVKLQHMINEMLGERKDIVALEAGCGSASKLNFGGYAGIVGIDISQQQLDRNTMLTEKILGDIQTHPLPESRFDLIVCWDVLEHLPRPEMAIRNFARAVSETGIIVLAQPNVLSAKGMVAKFTPHWFHVWWYRTIFGQKQAGTNDTGPFETFLRLSIAPHAMKRIARENGLDVAYFSIYESDTQANFRRRVKVVGRWWRLAKGLVKAFSLGKIDAGLTDYIIVLRRRRAGTPSATTPNQEATLATIGA